MTAPAVEDEALPGLAAALTGEIAPRLAEALASASGGAWTIEAAEPVRFRHRVGARAIVQYALTLSGPRGTSTAPAALWFFAGGKAAKLARKAAGRPEADTPPPALLEPTTGALLQVFPHDHRIPQIAAFLREPDLYRRALLGGAATSGAPELVRFRPGLCATFRWRLGDGRQAYVKIRPDADPRRTIADIEGLRRRAVGLGFDAPRPLGTAAEIAAVALEGASGVDFGDLLADGRLPDIRAGARRIALALAALHRSDMSFRREVDRQVFVKKAGMAAAWIGDLCPTTARAARNLAEWIAKAAPCLQARPAHMDAKPEHLVIGDRAITLLDLDSAARSDPAWDLAMLEMRIRAVEARGLCEKSQAEAALEGLIEACPETDEASWSPRHSWLKACAALKVAKEECQMPSEGWRRRASRLLAAGLPRTKPIKATATEMS